MDKQGGDHGTIMPVAVLNSESGTDLVVPFVWKLWKFWSMLGVNALRKIVYQQVKLAI